MSMIKPKHTERYILLAIVILILSLTFSIISLMSGNDAGRYQSFVMEDANVYTFDTKTGRLFLRGIVEGEVVCYDLGTMDRPLKSKSSSIQRNPIGFEAWQAKNIRLGRAPSADKGR